MNNELNEKLAKWAGWKINGEVTHWYEDAEGKPVNPPNFTESLDSCEKYLLSKLHAEDINLKITFSRTAVEILGSNPADDDYPTLTKAYAYADTKAMALCLAIEKIVDKKQTRKSI